MSGISLSPRLGPSNIHPSGRLGRSAISLPSDFDPRSLPNLAAWYDARYPAGFGGAIPSDGTALSQWNDLSGNGRHATQATGANQPLFRKANPNLLTYNQATTETSLDVSYSSRSAATIARSTAQAFHGTASAAATSTAAGTAGINCGAVSGGSATPVTPNATYSASISLRHGTLSPTVTVGLSWWTSGGAFLSQTTANVGVTSTGWTTRTITATADPAAAYGMIYAQWTAVGIGEVLYVDAVGLRAGSSTTWLPPVTLPNGLATVQFDGAAQTMAATIPAQSATALTAYFVGRPDFTPTTARQAWSATGSATANDGITAALAHSSNVGAVTVTSGNAQTTAAHVFSVVASASALQAFTDGTGGTAGAAASGTTGTTLNLGRAGSLWPGSLAAVLVYSAAHTAAQRQQVERWLGQVFGVSVA